MAAPAIIGHAKALAYLSRLTRATFPHTLLFTGPTGVGKRTVAEAGAAQLIGCTPEAAATSSRIIHLTAVDHKTGAAKQFISVDTIRDLRPLFALTQSGPLIIMIDRAQELHQESSNALLKIMEEPYENLYFMILARSEDSVLQTIRSRAAHIPLSPVPAAELRAALKAQKFLPSDIDAAVAIAEGRPGIALEYLNNEAFRHKIQDEHHRFANLRSAKQFHEAEALISDLFGKKEKHLETRADLVQILEWWLLWLRRSAPQHRAIPLIATSIPLLSENMHPRLLLERIVIELVA